MVTRVEAQDALRRDLRLRPEIHSSPLHKYSSTTRKWKSLIDMLVRTPETGVQTCLLVVHVGLPVRTRIVPRVMCQNEQKTGQSYGISLKRNVQIPDEMHKCSF